MSGVPTRFEDLKPTELYRSAIEDFALPIEDADKNKKTVLLAAFVEGGVVWDDYVAQHPEVAPVVPPVDQPDVRVQEPDRGGVITAPVQEKVVDPLAVEGQVRVAETPVYNPADKLLIKMERENPLFEVRGHRFTKDAPYALMSPKDAEYVLSQEKGFRQALPSELSEFYG